MSDHLRYHREHSELHGAFGSSKFGRWAERFARFFGTPKFIIGQTCIVLLWIVVNALVIAFQWDAYPFIALNLAFSLQAAYAAPLILLAQTRQASRDKAQEEAAAKHRQEEFDRLGDLVGENTKITEAVHGLSEHLSQLTEDVHRHLVEES